MRSCVLWLFPMMHTNDNDQRALSRDDCVLTRVVTKRNGAPEMNACVQMSLAFLMALNQ